MILSSLLGFTAGAGIADAVESSDAEAAYARTIAHRAEKIVATLKLADTNQAARVSRIIEQQYRDLRRIHETRDARIQAAKATAGTNASAIGPATAAVRAAVEPQLQQLHSEFLARLAAELSPEQVDQVKDGLTYGVVAGTYQVYLKMYPTLTDEQKQQIMTWLIEAREIAMDQGTADEKHAVFNKYKGRINNYLSKAGYDAKQGRENLKRTDPPGEPRAP